ncbi:MAG: hypothetical protein H8E86_02430 [Planctomycetes bacterium]|nr:hypothetical protein [Planctomycetota bacterium]
MSRKKGPALYELISTNKPLGRKRKPELESVDFAQDDSLAHNVLTPGRSVRMSIGSIGVIVAICIALIVISYTMGFRRGSDIAREDYGSRIFEEVAVSQPSPPLSNSKAVNLPKNQPSTHVTQTGWGPITSDPRVGGKNYFTLIQTTKDGAVQLASFCREKGLETYAISGNNTRLYRVIALPGSQDPNDAVATDVRSKIHAIGQQWTTTNAGRGSDLKDAYQSLYKK